MSDSLMSEIFKPNQVSPEPKPVVPATPQLPHEIERFQDAYNSKMLELKDQKKKLD